MVSEQKGILRQNMYILCISQSLYYQQQQQNMVPEQYSETIKQLKTKLHHSFLEMSDLQQLHQQQIDCQKAQYQQKIDELTKQNETLKNKLKQIDTPSQGNIEMIFDDIDDSFFQLKIKKDVQENYVDQTIQQLLNRSPLRAKNTQLQQLEKKIRTQCAFIPNELQLYFQSVRELQKQNNRNKDDLLQLGKQYNRVLEEMEKSNNLVNELRQREKALKNAYQQLSLQCKRVKNELTAIQNEKKHLLVKSWNTSQPINRFSTTNKSIRGGLQSYKSKQELQKVLIKKSLIHLDHH